MKAIKSDELKHTTIIRIDNDTYKMLRKMSYEENISINQIVNLAIIQYLIQTQKK